MAVTRRAGAKKWVGLAAGAGLLLAARASLADHYVVPSGSMEPTLEVLDHILVDKCAYGLRVPLTHDYLLRFAGPARGDVVVLDSPESDLVLVKRVVAVPGDVVEVRGGALVVNGAEVPIARRSGASVEELPGHPHEVSLAMGGGPDLGPIAVPADRYLVLGDNRGNSRDGRFFGLVPREAVLGRAVAVFLRDGRPAWERP